MEQIIQMQLELMKGKNWFNRDPAIADTPEARETWDKIASELEAGQSQGLIADVSLELPI
jgi:hypothetical protein